MITTALIIAHAFSTNKNFKPELLYFGALIADILIIEVIMSGL